MKHSEEDFSEHFPFFSLNYLPRRHQTKNVCYINILELDVCWFCEVRDLTQPWLYNKFKDSLEND